MKIFKVKDDYVTLWELRSWFDKAEVVPGDKFGISWKVRKHKKLKTYVLERNQSWHCDQCFSDVMDVVIRKGLKSRSYDNHFGLCTVWMSNF